MSKTSAAGPALVLAGCCLLLPSVTHATAIAAVDYNGIVLRPASLQIDGVAYDGAQAAAFLALSIEDVQLLESAGATGDGEAGADHGGGSSGDSANYWISAFSKAGAPGTAWSDMAAEVIFGVTNTSSVTIDAYMIDVFFSAFNPGGNPFGALVDHSLVEIAAFGSWQTGLALDSHGCRTDDPASWEFVVTGPLGSVACGVQSPDESQLDFSGFALLPGETRFYLAGLSIETEVRKVPEPPLLATAFACLGLLFAARRRRVGP